LLSINIAFLIVTAPYVRFWIIPGEIYNEQSEKLKSYTSKQLKLEVDTGDIIYLNWEPTDYIICLPLRIFSGENKKIVDLEAHLLSVDWLTEDQINIWHHIPYLRKTRLEWEDGKYQTELKAGIDEWKNLKIAILDCTKREFKFAHENNEKTFPHYQENAIYKVEVKLSGHLEGEYDYMGYLTKADFVCIPIECELDFLPRVAHSPKLPKQFKQVLKMGEREHESQREKTKGKTKAKRTPH
jgi:hypothetical protein